MCYTDNERGYIMSKTDNILRYLSWWAIVASVGSLVMLSFVSTTFFIPGANFVATMFLLLGMTGSFPLLLASAVLLLLYFFGAKGVKMRSAWLPAVIAVPVLADFVMFFYYLFRVILFGVDFTWQTVPSFIYAAAVAVFLVLYYVGLVKERKGKQKDI